MTSLTRKTLVGAIAKNLIEIKMNISDSDGPLSTNIIIVLTAYEIIKADQTA